MERIGLAPGSEIGGYTVVAPLGSGGMGTVYRAVDGGGSTVALKLLHPHIGADAAGRERLRREVAALQRLRHPAVAAVLDAEADSTEAFIVTELVDGENLADHVRERGPLDADDLLALAAGLLDALHAVHGAGVVHRDLKPSNVLVTDDGPVLIDFGIAQAADDGVPLTSTGLVVGTPGYLAPELLDGDEPSPASDLWGWAAVLVFAATGRAPFGTRPVEAVLARARSGEVDVDGLGALTAAALVGALDPDVDARTSPDDVVLALTTVAAEGDLPPDEDGTVVLDAGMASAVPMAGATTVIAPAEPASTRALAPAAQDGNTVAMPASLVKVAPDEDEDDLDDDPDGVDWIEDDLDASEGDAGEGSGYERPPARRRWGSLLALALVVGTAAALFPLVTLIVVGVLLLVERAIGSTVESMHTRRERSGVRRGDTARAVATGPWHLLRAAAGLIPALMVSASVVVIVVGVIWWLFSEGTWVLGDLTTGDELQGTAASILVGSVALLGVLIVWFGPLSGMTRTGARRVLAVVAPGRLGAAILVVLCLVVSVVLVALVMNDVEIVWWPLTPPTYP
ncbi:serine/threonine-protein kinase [Cellulomonas sp. PhB150]|uniref:serine/threonine-protein kinase n=1 Tax=Cellulomonas sp. PhB150 TaxID=2485188 RepID=UPI000F49CD8A|nr:serine/threonine-protein kinase [Cellulomonas sp. PhB150]ROS25840.1 protein kinase-like protein [Cellulomonas sp. PhB150]